MIKNITIERLTLAVIAKALIVALLAIGFAGIPVWLHAAERNEEQTAYNEAIKMLIDRGCKPVFARSKGYEVVEEADYIVIRSKEVRAECMKKQVYSITWEAPTKRADGSELKPGEIAGYQLMRDDKIIDMSPCCEFMTTEPEGLFIRAVDTSGRVSESVKVIP